LEQVGFDTRAGVVDVDLVMTGMSRSQREKALRLLEIIRELESEYEGAAPIEKIKEKAGNEGISERFVDFIIRKEKDQGTLYSPTPETVARAVK
jgi:replicative DNA helicase Mcm